MQTLATTRPLTSPIPRADCLGCVDCKGLCRDVLDMFYVPEAVLHRSEKTP